MKEEFEKGKETKKNIEREAGKRERDREMMKKEKRREGEKRCPAHICVC